MGLSSVRVDICARLTCVCGIQEALWLQVKAVAAKNNGMVPTGLFIQSLNEMIDDHEKHLIALISGVPNIVLIVLYGVAIIASAPRFTRPCRFSRRFSTG